MGSGAIKKLAASNNSVLDRLKNLEETNIRLMQALQQSFDTSDKMLKNVAEILSAVVAVVGPEVITKAVEDARAGLRAVVWGSIVSAVFALVVATRIFASDLVSYFRIGARGGVSGFDLPFSFALFGIGHLVGLWVGIALFVGALIGWLWGVPHYSALSGSDAAVAVLAPAARVTTIVISASTNGVAMTRS